MTQLGLRKELKAARSSVKFGDTWEFSRKWSHPAARNGFSHSVLLSHGHPPATDKQLKATQGAPKGESQRTVWGRQLISTKPPLQILQELSQRVFLSEDRLEFSGYPLKPGEV